MQQDNSVYKVDDPTWFQRLESRWKMTTHLAYPNKPPDPVVAYYDSTSLAWNHMRRTVQGQLRAGRKFSKVSGNHDGAHYAADDGSFVTLKRIRKG